MIIRRLLVVGGLAAVSVIATVGPALAEDLSDYLDDAADAIYSGQRLVGTTWDGIESVGMVEIQHHGGMTTVGTASGVAMVGDGRMHLGGPDEAAISFVLETRQEFGGRYSVAHGEATYHLNRPAHILEVIEDGAVRIRLVVDDSTSAPVATEVFGADGELFRYTSMVDFTVAVDPAMAQIDGREYRMMMPLGEADLPTAVAGYHLTDVYAGPQNGRQAFYTDGLFTFSVFTTRGRANWAAIAEDEHTYASGNHDYLRVITPTSVWVMWNAPAQALALVGDLPPDHLDEVLAELPLPGTDNWLRRMWRNLFG